jgi:hypothetical protein
VNAHVGLPARIISAWRVCLGLGLPTDVIPLLHLSGARSVCWPLVDTPKTPASKEDARLKRRLCLNKNSVGGPQVNYQSSLKPSGKTFVLFWKQNRTPGPYLLTIQSTLFIVTPLGQPFWGDYKQGNINYTVTFAVFGVNISTERQNGSSGARILCATCTSIAVVLLQMDLWGPYWLVPSLRSCLGQV